MDAHSAVMENVGPVDDETAGLPFTGPVVEMGESMLKKPIRVLLANDEGDKKLRERYHRQLLRVYQYLTRYIMTVLVRRGEEEFVLQSEYDEDLKYVVIELRNRWKVWKKGGILVRDDYPFEKGELEWWKTNIFELWGFFMDVWLPHHVKDTEIVTPETREYYKKLNTHASRTKAEDEIHKVLKKLRPLAMKFSRKYKNADTANLVKMDIIAFLGPSGAPGTACAICGRPKKP